MAKPIKKRLLAMKEENSPEPKEYILTGLNSEEGTPDEESPELDESFFVNAKPFKEGFPEAYQEWQKSRGRPKVAAPKKLKSFKLSQDVIEAVIASGKGYNAKVDSVLRAAFLQGQVQY
jgi:uncharacterized protein (DUF4415 family)